MGSIGSHVITFDQIFFNFLFLVFIEATQVVHLHCFQDLFFSTIEAFAGFRNRFSF
jgi:hypothetical protein